MVSSIVLLLLKNKTKQNKNPVLSFQRDLWRKGEVDVCAQSAIYNWKVNVHFFKQGFFLRKNHTDSELPK